MLGYIRIKRKYHSDTKTILEELKSKPTFKFYIDFTSEGVFIETRMLDYENSRLEIHSNLVLNEIIHALNEAFGGAYFSVDGVECFTRQYYGGD